jgi:hypothetical protein
MTKRQTATLQDILYRMKEAEKYLERDDIKILHNRYGEVNKFIGSELNQLKNAIYNLETFITSDQ